MAKNGNLHAAKIAKNDEFYTQLNDVSEELKHYREHFKDKVVFCNCDDPTWSAFWKYFHLNFEKLGLKKLISTHYDKENPTYKMEYTGGDDNDIEVGVKTNLMGNGDFHNAECIELLKEADIVVTNPPFSLFREYVAQLVEYGKKFLIIGNMNAITYKEFFPLIKDNQVWLGNGSPKEFLMPDNTIKKFGNIFWYTNLDFLKRHEPLLLYKKYTPEEYPIYDNYAAFNVDKTAEIPVDRDFEMTVDEEKLHELQEKGFDIEILEEIDDEVKRYKILIKNPVMGVPISFLDKYCPEQFEIVGTDINDADTLGIKSIGEEWVKCYRNGGGTGHLSPAMKSLVLRDGNIARTCYKRILIRRKKEGESA